MTARIPVLLLFAAMLAAGCAAIYFISLTWVAVALSLGILTVFLTLVYPSPSDRFP